MAPKRLEMSGSEGHEGDVDEAPKRVRQEEGEEAAQQNQVRHHARPGKMCWLAIAFALALLTSSQRPRLVVPQGIREASAPKALTRAGEPFYTTPASAGYLRSSLRRGSSTLFDPFRHSNCKSADNTTHPQAPSRSQASDANPGDQAPPAPVARTPS
jgi:hypothetical protein